MCVCVCAYAIMSTYVAISGLDAERRKRIRNAEQAFDVVDNANIAAAIRLVHSRTRFFLILSFFLSSRQFRYLISPLLFVFELYSRSRPQSSNVLPFIHVSGISCDDTHKHSNRFTTIDRDFFFSFSFAMLSEFKKFFWSLFLLVSFLVFLYGI